MSGASAQIPSPNGQRAPDEAPAASRGNGRSLPGNGRGSVRPAWLSPQRSQPRSERSPDHRRSTGSRSARL